MLNWYQRRVEILDLNLDKVAEFLEIRDDLWFGWDWTRPKGICVYTYETLITHMSDIIMSTVGTLRLNTQNPNYRVDIDSAGNTWFNAKYVPPYKYLVKAVPRKWVNPDARLANDR